MWERPVFKLCGHTCECVCTCVRVSVSACTCITIFLRICRACSNRKNLEPLSNHYRHCSSQLPFNCTSIAGTAMESQCHWYKYQAEVEAGYSSVWDYADPPVYQGPQDAYMRAAFRTYVKCLHDSRIARIVDECLPYAKSQCQASSVVTTKILRMNIRDLRPVLDHHPDWKVVHQIRDPRGLLISERAAGILTRYSQKSIIAEASIVCDKMLNDSVAVRQLSKTHPNQLTWVKYEDYADAPLKIVEKIYGHIGVETNEFVITGIKELTHSAYDAHAMDQHRKNSSATAHKWTSKMTSLEKKYIDRKCMGLYQETGYPVDVKLNPTTLRPAPPAAPPPPPPPPHGVASIVLRHSGVDAGVGRNASNAIGALGRQRHRRASSDIGGMSF